MQISRRVLFLVLAISLAMPSLSADAQQSVRALPIRSSQANQVRQGEQTLRFQKRIGLGAVAYPLYGIDFSPYENGQDPNNNPYVGADQIRARLQVIASYTQWARSFSMTTGLENFPPIARSLGLRVAAGAWISTDLSQNDQEIANLISAANAGNVDIAIVGSEVLQRGNLSESQLIAYMQQVRQAIPSNIPVTTADTYGELLAHPNVIAASDVVFANIYPYWEGRAIDNAVCDAVADYNQVVNAAGGKTVVVSETGWPNAGDAVGAAVPSPANAAQFLLQFVTWARSNNVPFFYFEAFNEEWKAKYEGPEGAYWGIWDEYGVLKPWMQPVFSGQTEPINCTAIPCGSGSPTVAFTFVPPYGDSNDLLEGQECYVSATNYGVAVYINVNGGWWTKPTFAAPVTPLQPDGSWSCDIVTGGDDQLATAIAAFLIPSTYSPPALNGQSDLPNQLYQNSVANVQTVRSPSQSISGQVTYGGLPVPGTTVALSGAGQGSTETAPDGKYSFPNLLSSGPYTVTPSGAQYSYLPATQTFQTIVGNQAANFTANTPLQFIPIAPCRVADTRNPDGPFGGPPIVGLSDRYFVIPNSTCDVPLTAASLLAQCHRGAARTSRIFDDLAFRRSPTDYVPAKLPGRPHQGERGDCACRQ